MQENLNYVIVENSSAIATGGVGLQTLNDGVFIGTKKYFFFVPAKMQNIQTHKTITTTLFFDGVDITHFMIQKVKEKGLSVDDFENFMITQLRKEMESLQIISIDNDIEQFKVMAGFFGGGIIVNETNRKVGWKPFVNKLGKKKKEVKEFYINHQKLANK